MDELGEKWLSVLEKIVSAFQTDDIKKFFPRALPERRAVTWRHETVNVRGSSQDRYRDIKTGRFIRKP